MNTPTAIEYSLNVMQAALSAGVALVPLQPVRISATNRALKSGRTCRIAAKSDRELETLRNRSSRDHAAVA